MPRQPFAGVRPGRSVGATAAGKVPVVSRDDDSASAGAISHGRMAALRSVLRSANRVSEEPACSNRVQKKTLKTMRIIAAVIICASCFVPFAKDQARMPGTAMMKVPNSSLPISGSDAIAAEDDTAGILADEMDKGAFPALIHCFTASAEFGRKVLDLGLTISISGIVTFKNAKELQEVAAGLPADRMLVETDSPFLAPVPHRGRKCEPAFVADTAAFVANLRGEGVDTLGENTTRNFHALFQKAGTA